LTNGGKLTLRVLKCFTKKGEGVGEGKRERPERTLLSADWKLVRVIGNVGLATKRVHGGLKKRILKTKNSETKKKKWMGEGKKGLV